MVQLIKRLPYKNSMAFDIQDIAQHKNQSPNKRPDCVFHSCSKLNFKRSILITYQAVFSISAFLRKKIKSKKSIVVHYLCLNDVRPQLTLVTSVLKMENILNIYGDTFCVYWNITPSSIRIYQTLIKKTCRTMDVFPSIKSICL